MLYIDARKDVIRVQKNLSAFAQQQVPFAMANALTQLARDVRDAEKDALPKIFKRPTPFTVNSIRFTPAKKTMWYSTVFVMDIAAQYLYPYEVGGKSKLIGPNQKFYLEPVDYSMLNTYGNFPMNTLEKLLGSFNRYRGIPNTRSPKGLKPYPGKPGVFLGRPLNRPGAPYGVWVRVTKGKKGAKNAYRGLKLLIKFGNSHPAKNHLDFHKRATMVVSKNFNQRFGQALARAIATSKP